MTRNHANAEQLLLERRAVELARGAASSLPAQLGIELVVFGNGDDTFGIESSFVFEVEKISNITPLPEKFSTFSGVTNFRGSLLPLIDLRKLFGWGRNETTDFTHMLVIGRKRVESGLLADSVESIRTLSEDLGAGSNLISEPGQESIRGIASGGMVVLAGEVLLHAASKKD